jgi:hypothetical protein
MRLTRLAAAVCGVAMVVNVGTAVAAKGPSVDGGGLRWLREGPTSAILRYQASFNAKSTPLGGKVELRRLDTSTGETDIQYKGTVNCLVFDGTTAYLSGTIDKISGSQPAADGQTGYFLWGATDNGKGDKAPPDTIVTRRSALPLDCTNISPPLAAGSLIYQGNVNIHL